LHAQVERLLGLPQSVQDRRGYRRLLERFFGLYQPLEDGFRQFDEWRSLGLSLEARSHCNALAGDLIALGSDPNRVPRMAPGQLPDLPAFPHALGALYVLEGATLGGRIILRDLETRMGPEIAGATRFLRGHGVDTGPMWKSFQAVLDDFGRSHPDAGTDVLSGAARAFRAVLTWFTPLLSELNGNENSIPAGQA
jgi:heme oxygenase